jgi:hypothetical protein
MFRRLSVWIVVLAMLAAVAWLVRETRDLAEQVGWAERATRTAEAQRTAAEAALAAAAQTLAATAAERDRLAEELAAALARSTALADALRVHRERTAGAPPVPGPGPMPEGVRSCLLALREVLAAEGFPLPRFLAARALAERELNDVEVLVADADGLGAQCLAAARMTATLDAAAGRLELRFFDGVVTRGGVASALPADGWPLRYAPIDARFCAERLPALVQVVGALPSEPGAGPQRPRELDLVSRERWLDRLDRLLAAGGLPEAWHVHRLRDLHAGWFESVQVLASDERGLLAGSIDGARMAVEVDRTAGVVSLRFCDGSLRRGATETTIRGEGYRMLLPKLTPSQATDLMLGMVVER